MAQFGRGVRKQTVAIREQKIELAVAGNDQRQRMNRITLINICRLAEALEVKPAELFYFDNSTG